MKPRSIRLANPQRHLRKNTLRPLAVLGVGALCVASAHAQLTINATFDSSITTVSSFNSDPAAVEAAINAAIADLEAKITTPYADTVNLYFQNTNSGLAGSLTAVTHISYTDYLADLQANPIGKTALQTAALATMPSGAIAALNNDTLVVLTSAHLKALGDTTDAATALTNGGMGNYDSTLSFNLASMNFSRTSGLVTGNYDLQSAVAHELDEVFGVGGSATQLNGNLGTGTAAPTRLGDLDFFRYSAPGVRSLTYDNSTKAYFSIDGGTTNLVYFNQQGGHSGADAGADYADWGNPAGTEEGNNPPQIQDAFGDPYNGVTNPAPDIGTNELIAFQVVGYNLFAAKYWVGGHDGTWTGANWGTDSSGTATTAVPISSADLVFSISGAANQGNSTLERDFTISSLTIKDPSPVTIGSGSGGPHTLTISGDQSVGIDVQAGAGLFTMNANLVLTGSIFEINVNNAAGAIINGAIGGDNGLRLAGTGSLTLGGANTYTGLTQIIGGTLVLGVDNTIPFSSPFVVNRMLGTGNAVFNLNGKNQTLATLDFIAPYSGAFGAESIIDLNGGVLTLAGDVTLKDNTSQAGNGIHSYIQDTAGGGALDLGNATRTFNIASQSTGTADLLVSAVIRGNGGLVVNATPSTFDGSEGGIFLKAVNTYTGSTTVAQGRLTTTVAGALPATTDLILGTASSPLAGDVDLDGTNQTVNSLSLASGNTGGTGNFITSSGGAAILTVSSTTTSITFGGQIKGPLSLVKDGAGTTLTLTAANAYTGTTTVRGGTLQIGVTNALPSVTNLILGTASSALSGNVDLNGNDQTVNSLALATGNIAGTDNFITSTNGAATLTVSSTTTDSTFGGLISGPISLVKSGAGTRLNLTAANTYTGATVINAGTLAVNGSLAVDSAVTVNSGGALAGTGIVGGAVNVMSGGALNPGNLTAPGTLIVGGLVLNAGAISTFRLSAPGLGGGNDAVADLSDLTLGGTLNLASVPGFGIGNYVLFTYGNTLTNNGLTINAPTGYTASLITSTPFQVGLLVTLGTAQYWDGTGAINDGNASGGSGNWSATGNNWTTSTGATNSAWQNGTAIFGGAGGTVTLTSAISAQGMMFNSDGYVIGGTNTLTLSGPAPTISVTFAGYKTTISAKLAGTAGLKANGAGTLILTNAANTYTGGTKISNGTVQIGVGSTAGSIGAGPINVFNGGTLKLVDVSGNALAGSVTNGLGGLGTLIVNTTNATTLSGALTDGASGQLALTQSGTGTTTLTNAGSNYSGATTISGGVLQVGTATSAGFIGADSAVSVGNGATLSLVNVSGSVLYNNIANDLGGTATVNVNTTGGVTFRGALSNSVGVLALTKSGTGTAILYGNNTYTGATTISGGTLQVGNGFTGTIAGGTNPITVSGTGTLALNLANNGGSTTTGVFVPDIKLSAAGASLKAIQSGTNILIGTISGSGSVNQNGTGTTALTGFETYTGPTNVNAGTLELDGTLAAASTVTVNFGATLSGYGFAQGTVKVLAGGNIAPGVPGSPQTLLAGTLILNAGATTTIGLAVPNSTGDFRNDLICVTNLTVGGALNIVPLTGFGIGSYSLFLSEHTTLGSGFSAINGLSGFNTAISVAANGEVDLIVTAGAAQYWDGSGAVNNGIVSGGSGSWNTTSKNWTTSNGTLNSTWQYSSAVFNGTGGTVTLASPISTQGIVFGSNGYVISGTNTLTLSGAAPSISVTHATNIATISAKIAGTAGLTSSGAGTLILTNGANSYTGGTTISNGIVQIGSTAAAGSLGAGTVSLFTGGTLTLVNATGNALANNITNGLDGASTLIVNSTKTNTLSGLLTDGLLGTLALTQSGTGVTILTNADNSYSGLTTISKGTLQIGVGAGTVLGSIGGGAVSVGSGATLSLVNVCGGEFDSDVRNGIGATGYVSINPTSNIVLRGTLSDGISVLSVTKAGTGTATFTGTNTYTGGTTISAGTLQIGDGFTGNLSRANVNVNGTGILALDLASGATFNPRVNLNAAGATLKAIQSGANTLSGVIAGTGPVIQAGTGTTIVPATVTETYTGATNVTAGTLEVDGSLAAGSTVNVATAGTLAGMGMIHGKATLTGNGAIDFATGGTIGGTLAVTGGNWLGQGRVVGLVTSSSGIFTLGPGANLVSTGGVALTGGILAGSGTLTGSLTDTSASSETFTGVITGALAAVTMNKASSTLTLTGTNNYAGVTTVTAGTLQIGDGTTAGATLGTGSVTTAAAGTLTTDLFGGETFAKNVTDSGHFVTTGTTNNYAVSGIISGTGNFTKTGANTVTVTRANTYKGGTAVSGGTLLVNNPTGSGTGTGAVAVNNGGTLGGTGTITGAVTLNNGGTLEPGAGSLGTAGTTLHATSMLWNSGGTLTLQLGAAGDELVLTGALTKSATGTFTLDLLDAGITQTTYTLVTFASSTFATSNFTLELPAGDSGTLTKTATSLTLTMLSVQSEFVPAARPALPLPGFSDDVVAGSSSPSSDSTGITVTPAPEPGSATLLAVGGVWVLGWRRRRRG